MNVRRRIVLVSLALLAASCALFVLVSLTALDRSLRADASSRLTTLAAAIAQIVDNRGGHLSVGAGDRAQIASLRGPEQHYSIVDDRGRLVFGERPPDRHASFVFASTTDLHEKGHGIVTMWESDDWIGRIDRTLLLTLLAAGLALVAIGAFSARLLAERIYRLETSFDTERRFVADASHELRTPLSILRAETDLALRRPRSVDEYHEAFLSIDAEVARLEKLLDDLLDTMRDRSVALREDVHIAEVIDRIAERVRPATRGVRVQVVGAPPVVRGHGESIERAATAILHNAVTHGGAGAIHVLVTGEEQRVRIDVADDGPGFGDDALQHATERFWRADSARSRGGTGLGLSIARVFVEAHGGEVRLANGPERGAIVSLVLPTA